MIISYDIAVDLTPEFNRQLSPKFSVSLGDHGAREYTVRVLQGGEPYEIEEGSTVSIVGKKSDGHIFAYACTYADEYVYFTIEEQMTPVSGIVTCELSIIDASGNKVGSANFTYWVEPSPVTDGEASESDLQLFQQILDAADDLDDVREILDRAVPIAEQLGDVEKLLTAFPTEEASGSLLTLTDGADGIPAKKLTLNLQPHQSGSGDPSPDNVRPISGYTAVKVTRVGKNLIPYPYYDTTKTSNGITFTDNGDGSITANGTATGGALFILHAPSTWKKLPAGTYTLSGCPSGGGQNTYRIHGQFQPNGMQDIGNSVTASESGDVTLPSGRHFYIFIGEGYHATNLVFRPQIEVGNTATEYEPYQGETYTVTIPTSAGTVYGGSLVVDQDGSGTLTVDRKLVTINGTEAIVPSTANRFFIDKSDAMTINEANQVTEVSVICDRLKPTSWGGLGSARGDLSCAPKFGKGIAFRDDNITTADAWKSYFASNPTQFSYKLATPTTYTLTTEQVTTLLGNNTVWMDADGSIDLTYRADTQKYIDSRIALLNSNLAFIEDGTTASRAYTVGQFVLIGGQLYKVTSAIASGATFTPGTNVVATTVGTELTALN